MACRSFPSGGGCARWAGSRTGTSRREVGSDAGDGMLEGEWEVRRSGMLEFQDEPR